MEFLVAALALALAFVLLVATSLRRRSRRRLAIREGATELRAALERAAAPVPELLDAIGEYASWERAVFAEARAAADQAAAADSATECVAAYDRFVMATNDLFAIVEVYPDLSADEDTAGRLQELERATEQAATARARLAPLLAGRAG
ncbi:hypothetical protein D9V41_11910 [Aeromicrobium phragmitis]|uniref:LemA family protein n=1 Tax=Aeromicrobium phragmitis TaxID=2478914 RepID=A0A3L8PJJ6_9ACTN|nr:LemA family protein [Aeromicrobium phragmitis]RLV55451.1 hypothetical protein D9V41_11910 [Aeromicrobium phragmitis]